MTGHPRTPMHPDELPQQRVSLVADLPERPEGFRGVCAFHAEAPAGIDTDEGPRGESHFLGATEWAWRPFHDRLNNYYLEQRGSHWLLWAGFEDENTWDRDWRWVLYGFAEFGDVPVHTAAVYLLHDAWAAEAAQGAIDHFHWINHEGLLSVSDLTTLGKVVWPEEGD